MINNAREKIKHRSESSYKYKGIPIHCAKGVHEYADSWLKNNSKSQSIFVEVGAGSGALTARLTDSNFEIQPFDLDCTDWKFKSVKPTTVDCNDPEWIWKISRKEEISGIIALELIEHLDSPRNFIKQAASVLKSGDFIIISTPNLYSPVSILKAIFRSEFFAFSRRARHESGHISPIPVFLLEEFLNEAGIEVIHKNRVGSGNVSSMTNMILQMAAIIMSIIRKEKKGEGHELVQIVMGKKR